MYTFQSDLKNILPSQNHACYSFLVYYTSDRLLLSRESSNIYRFNKIQDPDLQSSIFPYKLCVYGHRLLFFLLNMVRNFIEFTMWFNTACKGKQLLICALSCGRVCYLLHSLTVHSISSLQYL